MPGRSATSRFCFAVVTASGLLSGCGSGSVSTTAAEMLQILMVGVFEVTPDGAGNAEPKAISFTLKGVELVKEDGTYENLWGDAEEATYRVVNRPQVVFEGAITDYVGTSFTGLRMTFDSTVTGVGKYEKELPVTLANPKPVYTKTLKVEKGKSLEMTANVQWKDIITRDTTASPPTETMTPPSFRFALDE